jgi:hypothetical protein
MMDYSPTFCSRDMKKLTTFRNEEMWQMYNKGEVINT